HCAQSVGRLSPMRCDVIESDCKLPVRAKRPQLPPLETEGKWLSRWHWRYQLRARLAANMAAGNGSPRKRPSEATTTKIDGHGDATASVTATTTTSRAVCLASVWPQMNRPIRCQPAVRNAVPN